MRLLPSSLTGRLVVTAVALVTLAGLLIAAATAVAMQSYLTGSLDTEVRESASRAERGFREHGWFTKPREPRSDESRGGGPYPGQGSGTVTAYLQGDAREGQTITSAGTFVALSPRALTILAEVPADGRPHRVELPGERHYRVLATDVDGTTVVAGLPTDQVDDTVRELVGWAIMFALLGVLGAGAAALLMVRRQLRPLREVARTAHKVTKLPLATGEIGMTARVPDRLTDERTEAGQVGAALNTLLGHVEEALDSRHRSEQQVRQFVADASHELRTPLATIQGYAELSRRTADPDPERLALAMGKVEAEATRMSSLVEDLLLLARLDSGRPLERNEVDLTKMVLEAVGDAHVVAAGHRWRLELGDDPVIVTGDELRLHQAITNLLGNARRHTPAGTTVTVGARLSEDGRNAVLTVHDDGPGIPADLQGSVFERFARGDSARTRASGGVGLGLSLVKAIADAHGGEISMTSRPGSTRFTISLPT